MIFGSDSLLIPYYSAYGEWSSVINRPSERGFVLNKKLYAFYDYLRNDDRFRILDLRRLEMELDAGLFFDSNIPVGYGVGSSGALTAALYDRYKLIEINDIAKLKEFLAKMESFFHGSSSGIDPLQCYIGKPFILSQQSNTKIQNPEFKILNDDFISDDIHIFLVDSKIKSPTAPLVEHFKELRQNSVYLNKFDNEYIPLVSKCIEALTNKKNDFYVSLYQLSQLQIEMLSHTIPEELKQYFLKNVNNDGFQIKLCGAGGGGYMLGFSNDIEKTNEYWRTNDKNILWIK